MHAHSHTNRSTDLKVAGCNACPKDVIHPPIQYRVLRCWPTQGSSNAFHGHWVFAENNVIAQLCCPQRRVSYVKSKPKTAALPSMVVRFTQKTI